MTKKRFSEAVDDELPRKGHAKRMKMHDATFYEITRNRMIPSSDRMMKIEAVDCRRVRKSRLRAAGSLNEGIVIRAGIALPLSEDGSFPDLSPLPSAFRTLFIYKGYTRGLLPIMRLVKRERQREREQRRFTCNT